MKNLKMKNQSHQPAGLGQARTRERAHKEVYYSPEDITLKLLAALGVERGVRFLDEYGKFLFTRS